MTRRFWAVAMTAMRFGLTLPCAAISTHLPDHGALARQPQLQRRSNVCQDRYG